MSEPLKDGFDRTINYLRLSITDRCNLRCQYCGHSRPFERLDHAEILTYEELLRLSRLCLDFDIAKVRLTGGEPLVRKGVVDFARRLSALPLPDVRLTTNGVLLPEMAGDLFQAGIRRVNVSLDTLDPLKYRTITGRDLMGRVLKGLEKAVAAGFSPVKINVVLMRGVNDQEIEAFGRLGLESPYEIRFIEYMPQPGNEWRPETVVAEAEVLERLKKLGPVEPIPASPQDGPARRFSLLGGRARIGLISPISHHFCPECNRLRLTADGKLLTCLFSAEEVDLKAPLRRGAGDEELLGIIRRAVIAKPGRHRLNEGLPARRRPMGAIGG